MCGGVFASERCQHVPAPIVCAPLAILAILQYFADRVPDLVPLLVYQSYGCIEFLAAAPEQWILGNATRDNLVGPGLVVRDFSAIYSQVDTYAMITVAMVRPRN